jgi:hypothetical protein
VTLPALGDYPTLGWAAVAWIEKFLRHGPGTVIGEEIVLDDEIVGFICDCYRLFPKGHARAGRRVYRRAILSRPKGRSKSEIAGEIVCFEAIGDCRFDHWAEEGETSWWGYEYEPGEPVGAPLASPFIRCLATEATQAGNTYDNVRVMLAGDDVVDAYGFSGDDIGRTRIFLPGGGEIRPSTASGASKDGGKETFAVDDETHLAEIEELRDMHAVVSRNLRKLKDAEPWMLETTTAFRPGMDSIAERAAEYAATLKTPEAQAKAGLLYNHREAPPVKDIRNADEVIPALREVYGPFAEVMDLELIASDAQDPTASESDFRRYWLNQSTSGANAWLTGGELAALFDPGVTTTPGEPMALGFDGSREFDATALIGCTEDFRIIPLKIWQHDGSQSWEVPEDEVHEAVEAAHEEFIIVRALGDPPYWETELGQWAGRWPGIWKRFPTQGERRMADAVGGFTGSIQTGRARAQASGDFGDLMRDHFRNAQKKYVTGVTAVHAMRAGNRELYVLTKDRKGSPRKIDAAPAATLAHQAAVDAHTEGLWERARRRHKRRAGRMVALD